jgi:cellulose synthase/poly-beta-1,6-N-acetylglucosamine synthase-like glycosyltransferase
MERDDRHPPKSWTPFIRVCIPALNEERYLDACLGALAAQGYPADRYEVVVALDSGTSDRSLEICRARNVKLVIEDRYHTIGAACRLGFEEAKAEIFAGTQADTEVPPDWLERIVENFASDSEINGVTGPVLVDRQCGFVPYHGFQWMNVAYRALGLLMRKAYFHGANYAYRRDAYVSAGGFSPDITGGEDNDLSIRVSRLKGRMLFDVRLSVRTSDRRLRQGYWSCVWEYAKLFVQINRGLPPKRFEHFR